MSRSKSCTNTKLIAKCSEITHLMLNSLKLWNGSSGIRRMTMMKMTSNCSPSNSVKISRSRSVTEKELINCQKDLEQNLGTISHSYSSTSSSFKTWSGRRMILSIFLVSCLMVGQGSGLRINSNGGYEDVVVSIGNEVPPIACQQLLQNLQVRMFSNSTVLNPLSFHIFCGFLKLHTKLESQAINMHAC